MAPRFGKFKIRRRHPMINDLRRYLLEVAERPGRFNTAVLSGFRQQLIVWFNDRAESTINALNKQYFTDKGQPAPPIFNALLQRYQNIWAQQMTRAFATAHDSLTGTGIMRKATRLTLVTNIARDLAGLPPVETENTKALGLVRLTRQVKGRRRRVFRQPLDTYLQMLMNTVPRNLVREYESIRGQFIIEEEVLYKVTPHPIPESADTCRFVSNKVLTKEALDIATSRTLLSAPLFHPNCRHSVAPIPKNRYNGRVITAATMRGAIRAGKIKRRK